MELTELVVPDAAAWRAWLAENHATSPGVWLLLRKKRADAPAPSYDEALDEVLCFGWIDSQVRPRDATTFWQRMTPRRRRSPWSARNVAHVAKLETQGRMQDAGRAQVRAAQADGRWDRAYGATATAPVADDLAAAIAADPRSTASATT